MEDYKGYFTSARKRVKELEGVLKDALDWFRHHTEIHPQTVTIEDEQTIKEMEEFSRTPQHFFWDFTK
jgi:hypothetical protein